MRSTTLPSPTRTSVWSLVSWAFFGLTTLATVGIGAWWLLLRPAEADPHVGPAAGIFTLLGMGAAWWLALICASLGAIFGLVGLASPATRTGTGWAAFLLNALFVAVSVALLA
jgi:hypothetical protein